MKTILLLMALTASLAFADSAAEKCAKTRLRTFTVTASTGNIQIVAADSNGSRTICMISFNADTVGNIKFTTGTGTNCGTGTADFSGLWYSATGLVMPSFTLPSGLALCVNFSATVNAGGVYQVVSQ